MLSLFPELFDWSFYVPFFFRMFIGVYLFYTGYRLIKLGRTEMTKDKFSWEIFGSLLGVLAVCLITGVYVQIVGSILFVISLMALWFKKQGLPQTDESLSFYILFALVALSFVFLGAGPYAFDLPL